MVGATDRVVEWVFRSHASLECALPFIHVARIVDRLRNVAHRDDPIFACIRPGCFSHYPIVAAAGAGGAHFRFFPGFFFGARNRS
jgi:hypothetical protein